MGPEAADGWAALALDPPRAHGEPPATGVLRAAPEDFHVEERLGFAPDGGDAHRLLWVEKRDLNTLEVARQLAAACGCFAADVGFAGMKDRRAVARQWFSVPVVRGRTPDPGYRGTGFEVLAVHAHSRKLRRGALAGNRFRIAVRDCRGDAAAIAARVSRIAASGFPAYFGPQRFGAGGSNLLRLRAWLADGRLSRQRESRAFLLSTGRSLAFHAVLAARVGAGSWNRLLPGEIVNLAGSRSVFAAPAPDEALQRRCREGDLHPTGPLCGTGGLQPDGAAGEAERGALASVAPLPARLAEAGLHAERRPLVARADALGHERSGDGLLLEFDLPRGMYATSLLRELVATARD